MFVFRYILYCKILKNPLKNGDELRHSVDLFILDDKQNSLSVRFNSGNEGERKQVTSHGEITLSSGTNKNQLKHCSKMCV